MEETCPKLYISTPFLCLSVLARSFFFHPKSISFLERKVHGEINLLPFQTCFNINRCTKKVNLKFKWMNILLVKRVSRKIKWLPKLFRDTMKLTIRINTELNCDHYTFKKIYFSLLWNTKFAYFAHSHSKKFLFIYIT